MKRTKSVIQKTKVTGQVEKDYSFSLNHFLLSILIAASIVAFWGKSKTGKHYRYKTNYKERQKQSSDYFENIKAKIVFMGNSMVRDGIDEKQFNETTQIPGFKAAPGGVASAYWYVYLKNHIIDIQYKGIDLLVIVFRDYELTNPFHGVTGNYVELLSRINTNSEPLLERLSYLNQIGNLEFLIFNNSGLYQERFKIKERFNKSVKNKLEKFFLNIPTNYSDSAINRTFAIENMNQKLQTIFELNEKTQKLKLYSTIENTYLPEIIKLAKENNKQLLFVRYKKRRDLIEHAQSKELMEYNKRLSNYFNEKDIPIIDFTNCKIIKEEHFSNGDHFNKEGMKLFTKLISDSIKAKCKTFTPDKILLN